MTSEEFRRNCEERVIIARRAGPFIPAEALFPGWLGARILLMSLIPRRWTFYAADNVLNLDLTFAANLVLQSPPAHAARMQQQLGGSESIVIRLTDWAGLEKVLTGKWNDKAAADLAGTLMDNTEVLAAARGFPTLQEIIRHRAGLKPLKLSSVDFTPVWRN